MKTLSCNKPNLIIPTRFDSTSFNYLWVGTIQIVNICFSIKSVVVVVVVVVNLTPV